MKGSDWKKNREGWISPDTVGLVSARQMKADGRRRPTLHRTTVSFATRMDEAATLLYPLVTARMALAVLTGFAALLTLTWQQCAIWSSGALAIETWSWFATRAQALGKPVGPSARTNFVANYISINGWWLLLAYLLWHTGTPEGLASGAVLFLAIVSICALLYYAAPVMFVLAGALPAFGATTVIAFADGHTPPQSASISGMPFALAACMTDMPGLASTVRGVPAESMNVMWTGTLALPRCSPTFEWVAVTQSFFGLPMASTATRFTGPAPARRITR